MSTITKSQTLNVYTKIKGKLACYVVDTQDANEAIEVVKSEMTVRHSSAILVVVVGSK